MKLNLRNYQAGIDLGTTNSAISIVDHEGIKTLEISGGQSLLPSCVFFGDDGTRYTGVEAINKLINDPKTNGHQWFKRKMGKDIPFPIQSLKTTLLAEELSGIILQKLQQVYSMHFAEDLRTVIVTVPARFDLKAVDATRIAAMGNYRLNGTGRVKPKKESIYYADFIQVETLMEPIAASLAYGMDRNVKDNGSWLVYDLGGGTFDAAVVNYRDGHMDVKFHAGDMSLGGHDFDRRMLHYIVKKLNEQYDLTNLETSEKYRNICNYLLYEIERLKIELSKEKEVILNIPNPEFTDNKGRAVKAQIVITREDYNREVGPVFQRSIEICLNLFKENKIKPSELDRVLLVGGPTQYPFFREQIKDQLKIDFDTSVNPMKAVTVGAAIFGSTRDIPEEVKPEIIEIISKTPADCRLEIHCPNQSFQDSEMITGKILLEDNNYAVVESVSISRADKGWDSGDIPVDPTDGTFVTEVFLKKKQPNTFKAIVNGKGGQRFVVSSDEFTILHGIGGSIDHAPYSLNITIKGQKCTRIIAKDAELPAEGMKTFYTAREIRKGSGDDQGILYVELTEGESENPSDNIYIGTLKIPNDELRRDLPVDTELEIFVMAKADRTIVANCSIPFTGQSFEAIIEVARTSDNKDIVSKELDNLKSDYYRIKEEVDEIADMQIEAKFNDLNVDKDIDNIAKLSGEIINNGDNHLMISDILLKVNAMLTETKLKLENFEKEFVFIYTREKIAKMKQNLDDNDGELANKINQLEDQLNAAETETSVSKTKAINKELFKYDQKGLGTLFLYYLYCYCLTKINGFAINLNELKAEFVKNYNLFQHALKIQIIIDGWNKEINNPSIKCPKLGKFFNQLDPTLQNIYNEHIENKENFPISDYDLIAEIFNRNAIVFNLSIIDDISTIKYAKKEVMKKAVEFAKIYQQGKIDVIDKKLDEFSGLYMIDPSVRGSVDLGGMPGGPDIISR
ncbi:MAG: Hsp70 family protein [Bacteroidales bacterium]|nr:Hsp70 family protein [Bacteroidales bacterium]